MKAFQFPTGICECVNSQLTIINAFVVQPGFSPLRGFVSA